MGSEIVEGAVIYAGYTYRQRIVTEAPLFPEGVALTAQVRRTVSDGAVLATLTTGGSIRRIGDREIEFDIPAAATAGLAGQSVVLDFVRTDLDPPQHLQFTLEIPVHQPVTRGLP